MAQRVPIDPCPVSISPCGGFSRVALHRGLLTFTGGLGTGAMRMNASSEGSTHTQPTARSEISKSPVILSVPFNSVLSPVAGFSKGVVALNPPPQRKPRI